MKTTSFITVAAVALVFHVGTVYGQPARNNPATGLPESAPPPAAAAGPAFGSEQFKPQTAVMASCVAAQDVHEMISGGRYEDALQRCVGFHEQYKTSGSLIPLLNDWVELGRRYPKAKDALIKIRDDDTSEFAAGRGYSDLFSEINSINGYLHQDDETYSLFKSFRDKDPDLARQCYLPVEGILVAKGDYQWCYDHMGDPQAKFDSIHQNLNVELENQNRMAAINEANFKRITEMNRRHGWTNAPVLHDYPGRPKAGAENGFVSGTRQLIEILVATGHKADADKIRDQAVEVLNDERLKSAVADAEAKVPKL